ncbi:DUF4124 domain-containing protein [Methylomonas sp. MgM2]
MITQLRILLMALWFPFASWAGVYKCIDATGQTHYQSSPCTEEAKALEINTKTGGQVDLGALENQKILAAEQKQQEEAQRKAEEQAKHDAIALRKQLAQEQYALTQAVIKQNPTQFSAYAIPPYDPNGLPKQIKPFEERLPDIEKFRRLAAQKALATGQCKRVEADELNSKSTNEKLVFMINCSSGQTYYYNESDLAE